MSVKNVEKLRNPILFLAVVLLVIPSFAPVSAQSPPATDAPPVEIDANGNVVSGEAPGLAESASVQSPSQIDILCFTTRVGSSDPCDRVGSIFTNVTTINSVANFPSDLSPYEAIYIGYDEGNAVDSLASDFEQYIDAGGGLVVSQPNLAGTVDVYPPGFEMTVTDIAWPGFPSPPPPVEFTGNGVGHPILSGLAPADISGNFDTVPVSTLGPNWSVLVKSAFFPHVALSVGTYGNGRLAFHSGNISGTSIDPGSDAYIRQLIEWAGADQAPGPDMAIDAIEVTQAIQDLNNSVELVAGKRTFVRVHVSTPSMVNDVFANLSGQRNGITLYPTLSPGNPGSDIDVLVSPDRGQLNDSFLFELPSSWIGAGNVTLTARLDPANAKNDPNLANNEMSVTVTFNNTPPLRLRQVNVRYTVGANTYLAATSHLASLESWLRRAYPISSLQVARQTFTYPDPGLPDVDTLHGWLALGKLLRIIFTGEDARTVYYGVVDDGGGFMRGKAAGIPSTIAAGPAGSNTWGWDFDGSYNDWYGGHEIGHTRNRYHAMFCGAGGGVAYPYTGGRISPATSGATAIYGFDIGDQTIYGPTWKDVMTYCSNQWISDFTYEGIRAYLVSVGRDAQAIEQVGADQWLAVMGMAYLADNSAQLESVYLIDETTDLSLPEPGEWTIVLLDGGGTELASYPFAPQELTDAEESPQRPAVIGEVVPWVQGTTRVEIRFGEEVKDARSTSANAPGVVITSPQAGTQIQQQEPLLVSWDANDPDGDALSFSVLFSDTGGETWQTLATGLTGNQFEIPSDLLPGGQSSVVRVVASDGMLGGMDTSAQFYVPPHAPEVTLVSPADGETFFTTQLVTFQGTAFDMEDGTLPDDRFDWWSSIDGYLGSGSFTSTVDLSTGDHVITLRATDYDGMWTEVEHDISVLSGTDPEPNSLEVSPTSLGVVVNAGQGPQQYDMTIRNGGEGPLGWTASESADWLSLSSTAGDTPSDLVLTVDPTGLAPGTYEAIVTLQTPIARAPVEVPIVLTVQQPTMSYIFLPIIIR